jgi:hypothetical protein
MKAFLFIFTFLMVFVLFSLIFGLFKNKLCNENFENYYLDNAIGEVSNTETILLQNSYLPTGNKEISKNDAYNIWWNYPVFKVGSYAQITNNIQYPNNPDDGTCMPASMCQTLYKNKKTSNQICMLPPVPNSTAVRINYYNA